MWRIYEATYATLSSFQGLLLFQGSLCVILERSRAVHDRTIGGAAGRATASVRYLAFASMMAARHNDRKMSAPGF
jgi:hypothetical protein